MDHTIDRAMVSFDELVSAKTRIIIRKIIVKIAGFYWTFESQTSKEYSEKISAKLEVLVGGLEQKMSDEHNSIQVFDIALKYLLENVDWENHFEVGKRNERKFFLELNNGFYVSKRNNCVHMGLDSSIFSYPNYANIIAQINKVFKENLADKFVVNYPQLIHTAKWKFDYIVSRKEKWVKN